MDWAREIRGTKSKDRTVALRSAIARMVSVSAPGERKDMAMAPSRSAPASCGSNGRTLATTSASEAACAALPGGAICAPTSM